MGVPEVMRHIPHFAWLAILAMLLLLPVAGPAAQQRPNLAGTWVFDQDKSLKPGPDGRVVLAAMLGDEFVALQNDTTLTLRISFQGDLVVAVYDLTGAESRNTSPGDVTVKSRATWQGDRLVIDSTSEGKDHGGKAMTIRTKRVVWIDTDGDLIIERSGTPASQVTPSRSVYRRVR